MPWSVYEGILFHCDDASVVGVPVLPRVFVRIAGGRNIRVRLLEETQVVELWFEHWHRHEAICNGCLEPFGMIAA